MKSTVPKPEYMPCTIHDSVAPISPVEKPKDFTENLDLSIVPLERLNDTHDH